MTKDIILKISGLHDTEGDEDAPIETMTPGQYFFKNGKHYVVYDEILDGLEGTLKSTIKFTENQVELLRTGAASARMVFQPGREHMVIYQTPMGPLSISLYTEEILAEKGFTIDHAGFAVCMQEQKEKARKARKVTNYMGADVTVYESIDPAVTTEFVGYDKLQAESKVSVLTTETELAEALTDGEVGTVIVEETPFYATMGGQTGDIGVITTAEGTFEVKDTIKLMGGKVGHIGVVTKGMIKVGDIVTLKVDPYRK